MTRSTLFSHDGRRRETPTFDAKFFSVEWRTDRRRFSQDVRDSVNDDFEEKKLCSELAVLERPPCRGVGVVGSERSPSPRPESCILVCLPSKLKLSGASECLERSQDATCSREFRETLPHGFCRKKTEFLKRS